MLACAHAVLISPSALLLVRSTIHSISPSATHFTHRNLSPTPHIPPHRHKLSCGIPYVPLAL
eukprot:13260132-Alexandrium_andersonii.AAC.1